ncbi:MAG TPA: MFS transporter [Allosphingosinicella sp.]|nr:MFS transporter [Allosphingosinicella sp.]
MTTLLPSLDTSIANVALPTLAETWSASFSQVRWVVLAYLIVLTGLIVGAGRLGDRLGRRRVLIAGIVLFTGASLLSGLAPSLPFLIAGRALQGAGAATMIALSMALTMETVSAGKVGRALGLLGSVSAVGTTLGPSLGGLLIAGLGWRAIFLVTVPLGAATLLLVVRAIPTDPVEPRGGRSNRGPAPLLPTLIGDRRLAASLAMSTIVATVMMATLIVGPFYLSQALGLGAAQVGLAMSAGPFAAALAGVPAGRLVDRFGAHRATSLGLAGMTAGLLALAAVPQSFGIAGYVGAIMVVTVHYALFQTANNSSVMNTAPSESRGLASGLLSLSRNLGLIAGASAMGAIFAFASSSSGVAAGMRATFTVAAILVLVALAAAVLQRGTRTMLTGRAPSWQSGAA